MKAFAFLTAAAASVAAVRDEWMFHTDDGGKWWREICEGLQAVKPIGRKPFGINLLFFIVVVKDVGNDFVTDILSLLHKLDLF